MLKFEFLLLLLWLFNNLALISLAFPCFYFFFVFNVSCIQQEEDSFYQQIGLKFEEETNKMLHLEHGFVWC